VGRPEEAKELSSEWPEVYEILAKAFWPGPLTLIAPKARAVSPLITSGLETVAVRCPRHPVALQILQSLKVPLAAPSANRFGHTSPTTAAHVEFEFSHRVPVVDGGACEIGVESTVLRANANPDGTWKIEILRPGGISREQLHTALTEYKVRFLMERQTSAASPGHLAHHYQPESPIVLAPTGSHESKVLAEIQKLHPTVDRLHRLELDTDPRQAARTLYQLFRELSQDRAAIFIPYAAQNLSAEWEAVWDRIERAATLKLNI
jgi:L-threonylcarbamoyladenylate synthase